MINNQNQRKVYLVIIALLLVANIAMLAFFLQKKCPDRQTAARPDRKVIIENYLKNEIGFDQQQLVQYDTLSNRHRNKIRTQYENAKNNKTAQLKKLAASNFSDSTINVLADQSSASQKIMEVSMFNHIKNIRLLCTPAQRVKFDTSFIKIFSRRGDGRKKSEK